MKHISRAALWFVTVAIPVVIAACYGPPYQYSKRGKVIDADSHAPLKDIKVTCVLENGEIESTGTTEADGSFYLFYDRPCRTLEAEDVDGVENGGKYAKSSITVNDSEGQLSILMKKEP